jgi:hypothetical protein
LFSSFEDETKFEEALKSYENCLALIPFHEEAQNSIEFLKTKILNSSKLSDSDVTIPGLTSSKTLEVKETLKQLLKGEEEDEKKEKDKERSKSKKKKDRKYAQKCVIFVLGFDLCLQVFCRFPDLSYNKIFFDTFAAI